MTFEEWWRESKEWVKQRHASEKEYARRAFAAGQATLVSPGAPAGVAGPLEALKRIRDVAGTARMILGYIAGSPGPAPEPASHRCTNEPCPVCGDGPSGEWSEGGGGLKWTPSVDVKSCACGAELRRAT